MSAKQKICTVAPFGLGTVAAIILVQLPAHSLHSCTSLSSEEGPVAKFSRRKNVRTFGCRTPPCLRVGNSGSYLHNLQYIVVLHGMEQADLQGNRDQNSQIWKCTIVWCCPICHILPPLPHLFWVIGIDGVIWNLLGFGLNFLMEPLYYELQRSLCVIFTCCTYVRTLSISVVNPQTFIDSIRTFPSLKSAGLYLLHKYVLFRKQ